MYLRAAAPARQLMARAGLCDEHRELQVQSHDLVEGFLGDVREPLFALDADAIDQQIEPPMTARRLVGRGAHRFQVGGVRRQRVCAQSRGTELGRERLGALGAMTDDDRNGAGEREPPADRFADRAVPARDEGDLVVEPESTGKSLAEVGAGRHPNRSIHDEAAIEVDDLAGDEAGERSGEETHHMTELLRFAETTDRNRRQQRLPLRFARAAR